MAKKEVPDKKRQRRALIFWSLALLFFAAQILADRGIISQLDLPIFGRGLSWLWLFFIAGTVPLALELKDSGDDNDGSGKVEADEKSEN